MHLCLLVNSPFKSVLATAFFSNVFWNSVPFQFYCPKKRGKNFQRNNKIECRGGFRGGAGGVDALSSSEIRPPADPKGPPLILYQKSIFCRPTLKFACGAENFANIGAKQCFGKARKINLVDLKKKSSKFWKIF